MYETFKSNSKVLIYEIVLASLYIYKYMTYLISFI